MLKFKQKIIDIIVYIKYWVHAAYRISIDENGWVVLLLLIVGALILLWGYLMTRH
jgi:hypothetical protein